MAKQLTKVSQRMSEYASSADVMKSAKKQSPSANSLVADESLCISPKLN